MNDGPRAPANGAANDTTRGDDHGFGPGGYRHDLAPTECTIECLCGALCAGRNWEEAGRELDAHLARNAGERV